MKRMKKLAAILLSLALMTGLSACGQTDSSDFPSPSNSSVNSEMNQNTFNPSNESSGSSDTVVEPVTDDSIVAKETTDAFSMTTKDGEFSNTDNVYTITSAGTYVISGLLEGQIVIDAGEEDEVILELEGATITYGGDSPIKAVSAGKVEISAKKDTENVINDTRSAQTEDNDDQGKGAIYAKCDLKIKGTGTLVINASYNNGIHTTKDLTIQKVSLKVTACNNAIKGNDSVTIKSGNVVAISTNGDGIKTENTDVNKNGETRGDITLEGGAVTVYAAGDGFQSAHNFVMTTGEEGETPTVMIYTGSYSGYTASDSSETSYKGVKVQNELNIDAGSITIQSYDDGLHADYGTSFDDGTIGQGTINISGGSVTISVYSPEGKTMGGQMGPGPGWGGTGGPQQQTVSGADGIHADYELNISGGTISIDSSYEGLEANVINISGGWTVILANDDGVNATKGNSTPLVNVTGGYLDVTVSASGDVDGIDSNGSYSQSGGIVITRGPNMQMAAAIDSEWQVSLSGGTLIILGYGGVTTSGSIQSYSLDLNSQGAHTILIDGVSYTITNLEQYGRTVCYSDVPVSQ